MLCEEAAKDFLAGSTAISSMLNYPGLSRAGADRCLVLPEQLGNVHVTDSRAIRVKLPRGRHRVRA